MIDTLVDKAYDLISSVVARADKDRDDRRNSVRQLQAACDTRAVFTAVHAQLDLNAMFSALVATRRKLQEIKSQFNDSTDQQHVADIIGCLDTIERKRSKIDTDWDATSKAINTSKVQIILTVRKLSDTVGLPYALPRSLTQELFFEVVDATKPASRESGNLANEI